MASLDEQTFAAVVAKTTSMEEYLEGVAALEPWLVPDVIDMLVAKISAFGKEREPALSILTRLDPAIVRRKLPDILQPVINMCTDTSKKVRELSLDALEKLVRMNGNSDLDAVIPALVNALKDQAQTNQAIEDLASCIFVQDVEAPALAVMLPIIKRGLRAKITEVQRKTCVILSNVCRLVDDPKELSLAVPEILPMVKNCAENISKPEARAVAERAVQTILEHYDPNLVLRKWSAEEVQAIIAKFGEPTDLIVQCVKNLCTACHFDTADWERVFAGKKDLCNKVLRECQGMAQPSAVFFEDNEEGQDLYKGEFSLAYGTLTLLRKTRLHLKRNRFYGLLGPNNCGKTTLMRAIDNEQIEGFPKKTELRTLFVEHEIAEREVGEDEHHYPIFNTDLSGTDWIVDYCNNVCGLEPKISREQAGDTMKAIGFGKERAADPDMPVTTYSGGWKVKMQLCAATLMNADILMLDEPTGHLDVANIQWLKDWLRSFLRGGGSIITTSHDTQFLEEMCTHIIDFQKKKLLMFKGNLKEFVDKYPEKKSYFTLTAEKVKFKFPEPGPLEGVKSLSKSILKMTGVTFQYPSRDKPTVFDICLEVSRVSRVAVIGPNGAGKSTAIKLLIGELAASSGAITKHPNMRLAYVAQHAFHHLEKHLNLTPAQYIMWRFAGNEDKESVELLNKKVDKDEKEITKYWIKDGTTLVPCYNPGEDKKAVEPEMILARHENKKDKTKEYEVKWRNKPTDCNLWVRREVLISMGAEKMVQKFDEKMAAESGLQFKPLTTSGVEKHLADFGIDAETASHTLVRSLSGGQKIKVVLAASTWQNPHIIVLDEPTNYLDRDSLGALTQAIHDYKGGVIIISHNREFAGAVCQEKWIMDAGRLRREGESIAMHEEEQVVELGEQTVIDAMGNEIKVNKQTAMTAKEKKQEIKKIQKMISEGKKKKTRSEDEIADLEYRLAELQAMP